MPIRVLSEVVAAQIAAGEVIERPASVVKELVENSLDAGASRIEVSIYGGGLEGMRVADDGSGIQADEAHLALVRHATSKLETVHDLDHIRTLGFRGEALASIAAVSHLTLTTRASHEEYGTRLTVQGGQVLEQSAIGAPSGTSIEVAQLFYNVPARRKFLKSDLTERRNIVSLISRYAMAYPQVRFIMTVDRQKQFHTSGGGRLADVIVETMGLDVFRELLEVHPLPIPRRDSPPIKVYGFTSTANQTRSNRSHITLFVNGRNVQDQRLSYAVVQAYHTIIPQGRYPVSVILIELPPEEVDVNVHPTKAEVRFRAPDAVFGAVQHTLQEALQAKPSGNRGNMPRYSTWADEPATELAPPRLAPERFIPQQIDMALDTERPGRHTSQIAPQLEDDEAYLRHIPEGKGQIAQPRRLPPLRVVGQIAATYIIAEGPAGLYLIDQHAAHERILYERFMARHEAGQKFKQHTLNMALVQLSAVTARFLEEHLALVQDLGFEIEPFGINTFRLLALPSVLADYDPADVLARILEDIESGDSPGARTIEEKIVRRVCKTAAVKAGQVLSYDEMQGLLRQLERCQTPLTCPHGRPTMIHMSNMDLAKEFGRT
jgi:DNA mismatch repair protein MutL